MLSLLTPSELMWIAKGEPAARLKIATIEEQFSCLRSIAVSPNGHDAAAGRLAR
jgi:hypothetical protein